MTSQYADALARLHFHLEMQDGFWFALAVSDDRRVRDALRREAAGWAAAAGTAFHVHAPGPGELPALAAALVAEQRHGVHWVVTDAGDQPAHVGEEAAGLLLMALNERREALRRHLPGGLVIEGRARLKVLLRNLAPDLFSVRACILEPEGASHPLEMDEPWWLGEGLVDRAQVRRWGQPALPWQRWATSPDGADAEARVALQEARRLEGRGETGARRSRLNALSRAVEALLAQGWVSEAAPVAAEMLDLATSLSQLSPRPASDGVPAVTASGTWSRSMLAEAIEANAVVSIGQGDLPGAIDHWTAALALREALVPSGPIEASTAPRHADLAHCRSRLGELWLRAGDRAAAERQMRAALDLRRQLVQAQPRHAEWKADLALSWSLLGDLYFDRDDLDDALEATVASLGLRRELSEAHAEDPRLSAVVSVALGRLALVRRALGDLPGARDAAEEALEVVRVVAANDPGHMRWQAQLGTAWSRLGDAALAQGDRAAARHAFEQSIAIRRRLAEEDPENARWQRFLGVVLARLAELALEEGRVDDAPALAGDALEIAEALAWQDPSNAAWQLGLAEARRVGAEVALAVDDHDEAGRLTALAADAHVHAVRLGRTGRRTDTLARRIEALSARLRDP